MTAPLISNTLMRSWSLSIFAFSKPYTHSFWSQIYNTVPLPSSKPEPISKNNNNNNSHGASQQQQTFEYVMRAFPVSWSSGALAGVTCSVFASPFELTKLGSQIELLMKRRQLSQQGINNLNVSQGTTSQQVTNAKPLGTFQIAKRVVAYGGVMSLYSGYKYHLIRDAIGSGVYFGVYDSIKSAISLYFFNTTQSHPISVAIAGALSGGFSWVLIYPIDSYKSQYQRDIMSNVFSGKLPSERTIPPSFKFASIFRISMYRGLGISLIRTSILGTIMFSCYEKLMEITA